MPEVLDLDAAGEPDKDAATGKSSKPRIKTGSPDTAIKSAMAALPEPAAAVHSDDDKSVSRIQIGDDTQYKSKRKAPAPPSPKALKTRAAILGLITVAALAYVIYYALAPKRPSGTMTERPTTATNRPVASMGSPGPMSNRRPANRSYTPGLNNMNNPTGRAPGFAPRADDDRPAQPDGIR